MGNTGSVRGARRGARLQSEPVATVNRLSAHTSAPQVPTAKDSLDKQSNLDPSAVPQALLPPQGYPALCRRPHSLASVHPLQDPTSKRFLAVPLSRHFHRADYSDRLNGPASDFVHFGSLLSDGRDTQGVDDERG